MTRRKSATANLTSVECVDCAGPLDAASRARCSACLAKGAAAALRAKRRREREAGGVKRPAAAAPPDVLRSARAVLLGAIGRPGEPGTVRAIGRRAVVSAVNNGGRWVLASAIRILDGEARPIDVERLQRVASAWRQAGSPVKRAGSTWAPRLEPKRRGAEPPELAGSRDRSAFA
jgi:hypothetical protein